MAHTIAFLGNCIACGYDLRGLSGCCCPECGRIFDPEDRISMSSVAQPFGWMRRWALGRAGWAVWLVTIGLVLAIVWFSRFPAEVRAASPVYCVLFPLLFVIWIGRLIIQLALKIRLWNCAWQARIPTAVAVFMVWHILILLALVRVEVLSATALRISRPAFERVVERLENEQHSTSKRETDQWAGLFRVRVIDHDPCYCVIGSTELNASVTRGAPGCFHTSDNWYWQPGWWLWLHNPM